jgi:hypothetical protein
MIPMYGIQNNSTVVSTSSILMMTGTGIPPSRHKESPTGFLL